MLKRILIILVLVFKLMPGMNEHDNVKAQAYEGEDGEWYIDIGYLGDGFWDGVYYEISFDMSDFTSDDMALMWFLFNDWNTNSFSGDFGFSNDGDGHWSFYNDPYSGWDNVAWYAEYQQFMDDFNNDNAAWEAWLDASSANPDNYDFQDWIDYMDYVNSHPNETTPPSCANLVRYKEDDAKLYGFDDETDPDVPYKSVEAGKTDHVIATITPPTAYNSVYFNSSTSSNVSVGTTHAAHPSETLLLTATANISKVGSDIEANCGSTTGTTINKLKVVAYEPVTKTVAVTLVHCQPHALSGGGTTAGYTSTDISDADITTALNKYYKQGVVKWIIKRNLPMTVDFDLDGDNKFNDEPTPSTSSEVSAVDVACRDYSLNVDVNLYIIDNSKRGNPGVSYPAASISFVFPNKSISAPFTTAHELGHSTFNFGELTGTGDKKNLMYFEQVSGNLGKLRKFQWDIMH